jgi:DNA mismatch repair ATPase MutL
MSRRFEKCALVPCLPCAATAVKELLENALDAGASVVRVRFVDDVFHFEVADDGCGIAASDLAERVSRAHNVETDDV